VIHTWCAAPPTVPTSARRASTSTARRLFLREDKESRAHGNDERISLESLTSGVRLFEGDCAGGAVRVDVVLIDCNSIGKQIT